MESNQIVLDILKAEGPMRPAAIAEKAGMDKKEIDKAIKTLKQEEKIYSPKRCFYDIAK